MVALDDVLMPNTYVKLMAQTTRDPVRLLAGTGLSLTDILQRDIPITVRQQLVCAGNAAAMTAKPDWHLGWAETIGEHFHGPLTTALLSAPTLGAGLDAFIRYMPLRVPYHAWRDRQLGSQYRIEMRPLIELGHLTPVLVEIPLLALLGYLRTLRGGRVGGAALAFAHPSCVPRERYVKRFRCEFKFGQRANALLIPSAWRAIPNAGYEPMLWRAAVNRCELEAKHSAEVAIVGAVRQLLIGSFDRPAQTVTPPTVRQTATRLHVSVRTLHRRLRAANLSYQQLLDEVRRQRADELLHEEGLKLGDIAAALGYRDPANFTRAYKRWFGMSPRCARSSAKTG